MKMGKGSGLEWAIVAENILTGKGFVFNFYGTEVPRYAFFPPFYPYFLAMCKSVSPAHWFGLVQFIQGTFFALGAVWIRRLAAKFLRANLASLAGYAVALWPPLAFYSILLTPACFNAAVIPGLLLLLDAAVRRPGFWRSARAGTAYGLLAYSLPSFLGSIVLLPLVLRRTRLSWARALSVSAQVFLFAMLALAPWTIRNAIVLRGFVPVSSNLGFNLAGSNNERASYNYNVFCVAGRAQRELISRNEIGTIDEAGYDRRLLAQGLNYMFKHPIETAERNATRTVYLWWTNPNYRMRDCIIMIVLMSLTLPLFIVGLVVSSKAPCIGVRSLLYAVFTWQTLLYMNFVARGRYSLELHPLMIMFAVLGAGAIVKRHGERRGNARLDLRQARV
jgi:hypothetical protein